MQVLGIRTSTCGDGLRKAVRRASGRAAAAATFYVGVKFLKMNPMILVLLTLLIYLIRCTFRRFRGRHGDQPQQQQQQQLQQQQQQPHPNKQSGWPYGARSTRDRREGLILQILGWYAFPARRAGRTRVPAPGVGSRLRCLRRVADALPSKEKEKDAETRTRPPTRRGRRSGGEPTTTKRDRGLGHPRLHCGEPSGEAGQASGELPADRHDVGTLRLPPARTREEPASQQA